MCIRLYISEEATKNLDSIFMQIEKYIFIFDGIDNEIVSLSLYILNEIIYHELHSSLCRNNLSQIITSRENYNDTPHPTWLSWKTLMCHTVTVKSIIISWSDSKLLGTDSGQTCWKCKSVKHPLCTYQHETIILQDLFLFIKLFLNNLR